MRAPEERNVKRNMNISLLAERTLLKEAGYKHLAPPEQSKVRQLCHCR